MKSLISLTHCFCIFSIFLSFSVHAKKGELVFGPTGIKGQALPKWPKKATSIHVISCEKGSPGYGKLKKGDIIIGIGNKNFTEHPLHAIANVIDEYEQGNKPLILSLQSGKKVALDLPKLGTYSKTAPYNCPKTDKIIQQTVEVLLKEKSFGKSVTRTGLLGLMATGEKKHLDIVAKYIRSSKMLEVESIKFDEYLKTGRGVYGMPGWNWGYNLIALGEYYLLTKDEIVLPAMQVYAIALANGQDSIGLWGHRMAVDDNFNRVPGYGIMNQTSLSSFMGMLFARKCGINDPVLDKAIAKTNAYVADHIYKGGFPYGVHGPTVNIFNNNGTSASAAICMSLLGNQNGTEYFSKICVPTHKKLTYGHASHFFNPLWTPLGASFSGPEVIQRFFKKSLWYFNSKRHWNGGFVGQGRGGFFAGQALLTYCLPRKALFITGREANQSLWVKSKEADELIMMSQINYSQKTNDELFKMLKNPFPQIRVQVANEISKRLAKIWQLGGKKKPEDTITPRLKSLTMKGSTQEKIAALNCLGKGSNYVAEANAKFIAAVMNNKREAIEVRLAAAAAIGSGKCGLSAIPFYNDILRLSLEKHSKPDPFGHVDTKVSRALSGLLKYIASVKSTEKQVIDKVLLYRVAKQFMKHKRQKVRQVGTKLLQDITLNEFHIIADELISCLENKDSTYHTYSAALNVNGIKVLAKLNIKEGLDFLEYGIFHGGGKWGFKYRALMSALPDYGANAKPYIPIFEAHSGINKKGDRFTPQWLKVKEKINQDKKPRKLISVQEAKDFGEKNAK